MEKNITQYMELKIPLNEILKKYKIDEDYLIDERYVNDEEELVFILSKEVE